MEQSTRDLILEAAEVIDELTIKLESARRTAVRLEQQTIDLTDDEIVWLARHLEGHAPISQEEDDAVQSAIIKIDQRAGEIINRERFESREAAGKL